MTDARRRRVLRWLSPESPLPTYAGVVGSCTGLGLIGLTWGQVAGEANVYRQIPYTISGGFTGLLLVLGGLVLMTVQTRRRDAAARSRQVSELVDILRELRGELAQSAKPTRAKKTVSK